MCVCVCSVLVIMSKLGRLEIWLFLACPLILGILAANPGAIFNYRKLQFD